MRIITWFRSRIFLSILYNETRTYLQWGSPFIDFTPNFARHFSVSSFLLQNNFDKFNKSKTGVQSIKDKKSSRSPNEDGKVHAEESNPELSEPEDNKIKQIFDKSDGKKKFSKEKKEKQAQLKIFKMRSVIDSHNLQIKIKNMLKYVEKGQKVFIEIRGENDFDEILNKLNNSKLHDFYLSTDKSATKVCLTYGMKPEKKSNKAENVETVKS